MDLSRWNTISLRISVLEYLTSSAVFLPLNHDFFFFLTHTLLAGQAILIHFQLPNKLKMNRLSCLLYFFSSELFCGFPPASVQTAPSCSSSSRSSSSCSTLTQENQDFSCKVSILCQATWGGNLDYEHNARLFCSKRANEPLETTLWVRSSTKLTSILTTCQYMLQLPLTLLRTEALTGGAGLHHNSS